MTPDIALLLGIIGVALILFSFEKIPADIVALGVLLTLTITGLLPADEAFKNFGSDAFIMILGLLILTASLIRTGVVDQVGHYATRLVGNHHNRILGIAMVIPGLLSSFMSNTGATAFFLPLIMGLAKKTRIPASKLLLPLAFATILASSVTLIATSTNIVVSGLMTEYGLEPLGMFELTPVGLPILAIGLIYMFFIGIRIIPVRETVIEEFSDFRVTTYLTETVILPESPLVGKTLGDSGLGRDLDLTVLRIVRGERDYLAPRSDLKLLGGDVLVVEGHKDEILKIRQTAGIDIKADVKLSDPSLQTGDYRLVEAVLLPKSPLVGRTLKGLSFRERFGLQVLAINRHGETIHHKISEARLQLGDILLLQGNQSNIRALQEDNTFRILGWIDRKAPNQRRAPLAIAGFAGALFLGTIELVPLTVAVFLGVLFVFLTRCITPEEAYREVEWRALILIGCMLGVGGALEYTGAAEYLASVIVRIVGTSNPIYLLGGFFILTLLLTQPMSNQAAAAVILPIAIQTATQLNLNPRAFAVMIAVAASCSFLTPLEPACLLVYGPGNYRFFDFIKVGSILSLIIFMLALLLVPAFWPLAL